MLRLSIDKNPKNITLKERWLETNHWQYYQYRFVIRIKKNIFTDLLKHTML